MASMVIHMCVANEVNKFLGRKQDELLIGSIAPDISREIGENKQKSHFKNEGEMIPNLDEFLKKYKENLSDDFVLGYYIHLYTDYLWFNYFIPEVLDNGIIKKLDGTTVGCTGNMALEYIYNDYTNLNVCLIDNYNLNLDIFYNEIPKLNNIIEEIPMEKINLVIEKCGIVIANSKETKSFVIDMDSIKQFIKISTELILANLQELNVK